MLYGGWPLFGHKISNTDEADRIGASRYERVREAGGPTTGYAGPNGRTWAPMFTNAWDPTHQYAAPLTQSVLRQVRGPVLEFLKKWISALYIEHLNKVSKNIDHDWIYLRMASRRIAPPKPTTTGHTQNGAALTAAEAWAISTNALGPL